MLYRGDDGGVGRPRNASTSPRGRVPLVSNLGDAIYKIGSDQSKAVKDRP
jgi:hypothetical protein